MDVPWRPVSFEALLSGTGITCFVNLSMNPGVDIGTKVNLAAVHDCLSQRFGLRSPVSDADVWGREEDGRVREDLYGGGFALSASLDYPTPT